MASIALFEIYEFSPKHAGGKGHFSKDKENSHQTKNTYHSNNIYKFTNQIIKCAWVKMRLLIEPVYAVIYVAINQ